MVSTIIGQRLSHSEPSQYIFGRCIFRDLRFGTSAHFYLIGPMGVGVYEGYDLEETEFCFTVADPHPLQRFNEQSALKFGGGLFRRSPISIICVLKCAFIGGPFRQREGFRRIRNRVKKQRYEAAKKSQYNLY